MQPTFTPEVDRPVGMLAFRRKLETKAKYEIVTISNDADASQKTERFVSSFFCRLPVPLRMSVQEIVQAGRIIASTAFPYEASQKSLTPCGKDRIKPF